MKIYQHVDELNEHDGIGNDILGFHLLLQELGFANSIITRISRTKNKFEIYSPFRPPSFFEDDIHILHYGGTGYPCDFFENISGKKILRFHNMTPVSFFNEYMTEDLFKTFDKNEVKSCLELYSLHSSLSCALHDSAFNQTEYLRIVGERAKSNMEIMPIIRNYPDRRTKKTSAFRVGFVGRFAPNKKIEDLIFTLYYLRKINPDYTLILIGKKNPIFESYNKMLDDLISQLDLSSSIEIYENMSDEGVVAQLSSLDIYLSMSEHEGFGIPILDAMSVGIPVLAYSSSAVVETVRNAGILFTEKEFPLLAEMIHKIINSPDLYSSLLKSQSFTLKKYSEFPFKEKLLEIIQN